MENPMSLQVKYACGTCGLEIIESTPFHKKHLNTVSVPIVWHECIDGYVVPLQSSVEKVLHGKTDHK